MTPLLSICGTVTVLAVYITYFRGVSKGPTRPNPATFLIWTVTGVINMVTYFQAADNPWKAVIVFAMEIGCGGIFFYSLFHGKFTKLEIPDWFAVALAAVVGVLWQTTGDPKLANLCLQGIYLISFFPVAKGLAKGIGNEAPLPWALAVIAYLFHALAVLSDWHENWIELAFPIVNGIFGNGTVLFLIYYKKPRK